MPEPTTIKLRQAVPADVTQVRELVRLAYAQWVPVIGREPLPMTADYEKAIRDHRIDLLHAEGRLVALIETIAHDDHLLVENVAVLPECQGKGFGHRLLAHAEELALAHGLPEMRLFTNGAFAANIALYQALGYRIDREEPFKGGTVVHMSKTIASRRA